MLLCRYNIIIRKVALRTDIDSLQSYLVKVLGIKVKLLPWKKRGEVPFFLTDSYEFYEAMLLKQKCLFIISNKKAKVTPAMIKKQLAQVQKKSVGICIFVQEGITYYNRKRLIEHRIPFIIPDNQMFLPQIGVDLREHYKAAKNEKKSFSPAAQAVIINTLLTKNVAVTPSQLSADLGYTLMTMSRAFDEIESVGIAKATKKGKERILIFKQSKKELWQKAKPLMKTPIKKRIWAKGKKPRTLAGLSALSKETMLASPHIPIFAIGYKEWKKMNLIELPDQEMAAFELEIWHYDPSLFAKNGIVDRYSLYLSLFEASDERVESALEIIMEK